MNGTGPGKQKNRIRLRDGCGFHQLLTGHQQVSAGRTVSVQGEVSSKG